jgi:hypothetical protein
MSGNASLGNRSLGRMPTVIPAKSAIALTADHLKKRRYQAFPRGTYVEISAFVCIWRNCHGIERWHFLRRGRDHFHHPRRRLWRRTHDGHISLEGADRVPPARVILPSTADAAQPPSSQPIATAPEPPLPPSRPVKGAQAPVERQVEKVDTRKAEAEQRERRKRYAERKAKWQAERIKRQQPIEQGEHQEAPIMAFGSDEPRRSGGFGFFGN